MIRNWDEKDEAEATQSVWSELSLGGGPARHLTRDGPRQLCPGLGTHLGAERWGRGEQALRCPCCRGCGAQGDAADTSLDCFRFLQLAGRRTEDWQEGVTYTAGLQLTGRQDGWQGLDVL